MKTGRKFKISPTQDQQRVLRQWIGCQRYIYNAKVEDMRYQMRLRSMFVRQFPEQSDQFVEFNQQYSAFAKGVDFLKQVPSQVLRNGAYRFMQAVSRMKAKLGKKPKRKTKHGKQSVLITSELFSIKGNTLVIGTRKCPVGSIHITAHLDFTPPKMLSISVDGSRWFVSFPNDDDHASPLSFDELVQVYSDIDEADLMDIAVGIDRGVAINVACSNETNFTYSPEIQKKLAAALTKKKRYQRQMSRRFKKGQQQSKNYYRAKASKQKAERKIANIRRDFNHKASRTLVNSDPNIIIFEKLNLKGMTKAPAPKQDDNGHYLPNGAHAKAGLNKAILNIGMGQFYEFTEYKALKKGKLVFQVPANYSSQECSECGYIHKENRLTQALFLCQNCGHTENADTNAAKVVRKRGVRMLVSGALLESKKVRRTVKVGRNAPRCDDVGSAAGSPSMLESTEQHNEATPLAV